MLILACTAAILWLTILLLPWQPWRNREVLENAMLIEPGAFDLSDITVVIPARDEAEIIASTLAKLTEQGRGLRIILVDDHSSDGTAECARQAHKLDITTIRGAPLPPGWAGKLWALEQGVQHVQTHLTLLLDADIHLAPGVIQALKSLMQQKGCSLVSVMAALHMQHFWEKLLNPAFIYFFKMLYPFALSNSRDPRFAAAAGGCILMETRLFDEIGGLQAIRNALIDDCALAAQVKRKGARTWIGQSRMVESIRPYAGLTEIWNMVARSAYTQLRYSPFILLLCTIFMMILFWVPPLGILVGDHATRMLSLAALLLMLASYQPTLRLYRLNPTWSLLMPLIGGLYLGMTWSSAIRYYRGLRSQWKGRVYQT